MALLLRAQGLEEDMQYIYLPIVMVPSGCNSAAVNSAFSTSFVGSEQCFPTPQAEDCMHKRQLQCKLTIQTAN